MADITDLSLEAPALRDAGERVLSTDEMTGIQALERKYPTLPMGLNITHNFCDLVGAPHGAGNG
jgi:hypothetical protein